MTRKKTMNIFTESEVKRGDWRTDILNSIILTGSATHEVSISTAKRSQVVDFNASLTRIKRSLIDKFSLILSKPDFISSDLPIRCCLCSKAISFNSSPAWYYLIKYNINQFAAFICFDSDSP